MHFYPKKSGFAFNSLTFLVPTFSTILIFSSVILVNPISIKVQASTDKIESMLDLVNDLRRQNGVEPLSLNKNLTDSAQWYAEYLANNNWLDHTEPNGRSFDTRIKDFGYSNVITVGENIALGSSDPQTIFNQWLNSDVHRRNILARGYCEIGIGLANNGNLRYGNYWVQNFGCRYDFQKDSLSDKVQNSQNSNSEADENNQKDLKKDSFNQQQIQKEQEEYRLEPSKQEQKEETGTLTRKTEEKKDELYDQEEKKYYASLFLKRDFFTERESLSACLWSGKKLLISEVLDSNSRVNFTLSVPQTEVTVGIVQAKVGSSCQKAQVLARRNINLYQDQETVLNLTTREDDSYVYTTLKVDSAKGRLF